MSEQVSEAGTIRRTSRTRAARKPKKNQIPLGISAFVLIVAVGAGLAAVSPQLGLFWVIGNAFGYILQKSRFCFTASLRDPYLTKGTSLTKAVLTAFAVTTIGFAAIMYSAASRGLPVPGMSFVVPISPATAVGGFLFGIGMVIAGGCASGTLMRVGEGFVMQILALFFFIAGSLLGAWHFGWWKLTFMVRGVRVFLPELFAFLGEAKWIIAVIVQLLIIACLWIAADKWAKRHNAAEH